MHGDAALSEEIRLRVFPNSRLRGEANLLIMPTLDAANISFNLLKTAAGGGVTVGPILLGAARPVHILTPSATVRRIVNMTALAVADANAPRGQEQPVLMETARRATSRLPGEPDEAARRAGAHRRRRARRLPGRACSRRCATSSASPTRNPFPILCGTSAGAINAATPRRVRRRLLARRSANLLEVWEHMRCDHIYRTDAWRIMKSGARWLARDDAASRATTRSRCSTTRRCASMLREEPATSSASSRTSTRARSTRCASRPRATPRGRACRSSRAAAASRAGSATSASARRSR